MPLRRPTRQTRTARRAEDKKFRLNGLSPDVRRVGAFSFHRDRCKQKPRRSGAFGLLGRLAGCGGLGLCAGVLSDAVLRESVSLHKVNGGELLGSLLFARSLDAGRYTLLV